METQWFVFIGLGLLWHGLQIIWVGQLPRALRGGEVPTAEKGTPEAFMYFWLDQYSYIGLTFALLGIACAVWGVMQ